MLIDLLERGGRLCMIFNSEFDRTLWLMIKGDINNRKRILDFIKSIPYELILDIRDYLIEYDKYKKENEGIFYDNREYRTFNKQLYSSVGELYSFNIDVRKDILSITKSIYVMGVYYKNISIELVNINKDFNLLKVNNIGVMCYPIDGFGKFKKINYGVMDIGLTDILLCSVNNDIYRFCGFVNLDKDISLNLDNISGKLIKTKKMNIGDDKRNV